jgi:hypothetical protein
LIVVPSLAGPGLGVATVCAFLTRRPLKIAAGDRRRGRRFPRTPVAGRFALLYGSVPLAGLAPACATAPSWEFLTPLALLVLALRALHGFNERGPVTAKRVGARELIYGALTVAAVEVGPHPQSLQVKE